MRGSDDRRIALRCIEGSLLLSQEPSLVPVKGVPWMDLGAAGTTGALPQAHRVRAKPKALRPVTLV